MKNNNNKQRLNMDIIYVPFHDLKLCFKEGFRTRDAHLYKCFRANANVSKMLVVNRPTSFIEVLLGRKKVKTKGEVILKDRYCYLQKIDENSYCIDMLSFDIVRPVIKKRLWIPTAYSKKRLSRFYMKCLKFLQIDNAESVAYTSTPLTMPFFSGKIFKRRIFDAVDNLLKYDIFKNYGITLNKFYQEALDKWDLFLCNSNDSYQFFYKEGYNNMCMIANGVELSDFKNKNYPKPEDLSGLKMPIIGYGGKMQVMFDKTLLKELSLSLPDVSIVLVGQILNEKYMKEVFSLPNVYYLGDKPYAKYKAYVSNFDICIIPYRKETQHGGDPIKFYEYLATGKPTVSTEIGEIAKYANNKDVFVVNSQTEFIDALKTVIDNKWPENDRHLPDDITWEYKAQLILEKIENANI